VIWYLEGFFARGCQRCACSGGDDPSLFGLEIIMSHVSRLMGALVILGLAGTASAQTQDVIFPTLAHAANNLAPFNISDAPGMTHHQVYASSLFAGLYGGAPVSIEAIAFAPGTSTTFNSHVVVRLGYTQVQPPAAPDAPVEGGGGAPNAVGAMHTFYSDTKVQAVMSSSSNFQFDFQGSPFVYDPSQGNLLVEIVVTQRATGISVSRAAGSEQSTRSYVRHAGAVTISPTTALRTQFTVAPGGTPCYADCDGNGTLNVDDFLCFLDEFAQAASLPPSQQISHYANCDGSTTEPILTVDDFLCFGNAYAQGCP
jgi:hypothetical protein